MHKILRTIARAILYWETIKEELRHEVNGAYTAGLSEGTQAKLASLSEQHNLLKTEIEEREKAHTHTREERDTIKEMKADLRAVENQIVEAGKIDETVRTLTQGAKTGRQKERAKRNLVWRV